MKWLRNWTKPYKKTAGCFAGKKHVCHINARMLFFGIGQGPAGYTILEQEGKVYQNYGWMDHSPAVRGAYECTGSV